MRRRTGVRKAITFLAYDPKSSKNLRASVTTNLLATWIRKEEISKIKRAQNERRQKVADAHKVLQMYQIGVKYEEEKIYECIDVIQQWLEVRRKDSVSVIPEKKEKVGGGMEKKRAAMKKMTSRQIQLAAITDAGAVGEGADDEEEEVMMSTAMVLKKQGGGGGGVDLLSLGAMSAVSGGEAGNNNPQDGEEEVEVEVEVVEEKVEVRRRAKRAVEGGRVAIIPTLLSIPNHSQYQIPNPHTTQIPAECGLPLADILGNSEEETFMDKDPHLLRQGNEAELVLFLLNRLNVFVGTKKGSKISYSKRHVLMFPHDVQNVVKELSAEKLQGLWRMRQARKYIKELLISRWVGGEGGRRAKRAVEGGERSGGERSEP